MRWIEEFKTSFDGQIVRFTDRTGSVVDRRVSVDIQTTISIPYAETLGYTECFNTVVKG